MTKPSVIVFDLGKVLVDFDYSIAARRIAADARMSLSEIQEYLDHSPLLVRYETGLLTRQEFYDEVRSTTGYLGDLPTFGRIFADIFTEIPAMTELHATFRQKGFPTYIFSNTNDLAIEHVSRNFPFFAHFDGYIYSYQVGAMKPQGKIYDALETLSGRNGADILYLDDRRENIEAGAARGWQVVLQESPERTLAAIEKLGVWNHA